MWSSKLFLLHSAVSHVLQGPSFSGSRFFRVQVQGPGPGFRSRPGYGPVSFEGICTLTSNEYIVSLKVLFASVHKNTRQDESISYAFLVMCVRLAFIGKNGGLIFSNYQWPYSCHCLYQGPLMCSW